MRKLIFSALLVLPLSQFALADNSSGDPSKMGDTSATDQTTNPMPGDSGAMHRTQGQDSSSAPVSTTNTDSTPDQGILHKTMSKVEAGTNDVKQGTTKLLLTNDSFVKKATIANRTEVELSQLAITKSSSSQIKSFAQKMVTDHTAASTELAGIAKSENIPVPDDLDHSHQAAVDKLSKLSGVKFDDQFSKDMANAHDKAVNLFTAAANDKKLDPQLQQFAAKTLPTLKDHQHEAHQLDTNTAASR